VTCADFPTGESDEKYIPFASLMLFVTGDNMNRAKANSLNTPFLILMMGLMLMVILPSVLNRASASKTEAQEQTSISGPRNVAVQTSATGCTDVSFAQPAGSPVGAGTTPKSIAIGDFNTDGKSDMAVANFDSDNVTILLGNGNGGFTEPDASPVNVGGTPVSVTVGDFNLDGKPDLATANSASNAVRIRLGNGSGGFTQPASSQFGAGSVPNFVTTGDFNGDGKPDLAATSQNDNNVTVQLNTCTAYPCTTMSFIQPRTR
jgi:hypothetical protein